MITAALISCSVKDGGALECNRHVLFVVDGDAILGKIEVVPLSDVLPTLVKDVENSLKVSAWAAFGDSCWNGSLVTYFPLLVPPLATPTLVVDRCRIRRPALILLVSLK